MKARLFVGTTLLIAVAGSVWLAGIAGGDVSISRQRYPVLVKASDLFIQKVTIASLGNGDFPTGTIEVTIKNKGEGASPATVVAGFLSRDMTGNPAVRAATAPIGALAPGAMEKVTLSFVAVGYPWMDTLVVVADAPVAGKPCGQATESNEENNVFCTSFDSSKFGAPHVLKGPGAG
jgi:hypothetical protein